MENHQMVGRPSLGFSWSPLAGKSLRSDLGVMRTRRAPWQRWLKMKPWQTTGFGSFFVFWGKGEPYPYAKIGCKETR